MFEQEIYDIIRSKVCPFSLGMIINRLSNDCLRVEGFSFEILKNDVQKLLREKKIVMVKPWTSIIWNDPGCNTAYCLSSYNYSWRWELGYAKAMLKERKCLFVNMLQRKIQELLKISIILDGCACKQCSRMFNVPWLGARMFSFGRLRIIIGTMK